MHKYTYTSEKAMAPHSSTLAWKIPWTEEPCGLQSGSRTRLSDFTFTFHFHALEKEMATHSSVLAWRILGMAEPGGLPSMWSHRVRHDESDLAAAAAAAYIYIHIRMCVNIYIYTHTHTLKFSKLCLPFTKSFFILENIIRNKYNS